MTSHSDDPPNAGFTLLEMLVVLVILGLLVTLVTSGRPSASANADVRLAAGRLASALREARSQAIVEDRPVGIVVDVVARRFGIGDAADQPLPPDARVAVWTVSGEVLRQRWGRIRFNPDGSSSGGRIDLEAAARTVSVGVDWLSGEVSVVQRP